MPWSISISQILTVAWLVALVPTLDVAINAARIAKSRRRATSAALAAGADRHVLGGRAVARTPCRVRRLSQASRHSIAACAIPPLRARHLRDLWLPCLLHGAAARLVGADDAVEMLQRLRAGKNPRPAGERLHRAEHRIPGLRLRPARISRPIAGARAAAGSRPEPSCSPVFSSANIFYIAPGRTALAVMPLLLIVFGFRYFGWRGVLAACVAGAVLAAVAWAASPFLRARVMASISEVRAYRNGDALSSSAIRLEIWKKSLVIHRRCAGARPRHRLDPGAIPPRGGGRRRVGRYRRAIRTIRSSRSRSSSASSARRF